MTHPELTALYLNNLKKLEFSGEIRTDFSTRLTLSTDNSIYQRIPEAVLFPKSQEDVVKIFKLAGEARFQTIRFSPRAGGTGTDGQSLTSDILIDCSKYLTQILEINLQENFARVEPGVVLDQLNLALKPHGVFFAPQVSPSNRACIGGMFNTDGAGMGSAKYGRTSEHVLGVTGVLANGDVLRTSPEIIQKTAIISPLVSPIVGETGQQATGLLDREGTRSEKIKSLIFNLLSQHQDLIKQKSLKMPRFLTGYNLAHPIQIKNNMKIFDLTRLLSGSEGTLAMITELKLKLSPIPKYKALLVIKYLSFDQALRHGAALVNLKESGITGFIEAIETIDDKIINLARTDEIFLKVKPMFEQDGPDLTTQAINLVEISAETPEQLSQLINVLKNDIVSPLVGETDQRAAGQLGREGAITTAAPINGLFITKDPKEIFTWWDLRKKSVGLLANLPGKKQPVPFVEDTAVDPSVLPEFIQEFRKILDQHDLIYGMFGHIDTGCIHVRPALDMTDPQDAQKIKIISDQVHQLAKKYGGLLWAEHGAGFRSCYISDYFGDVLTEVMRDIKKIFDPHNQLNPGKIISADPSIPLVQPGTELRADHESQVPEAIREKFEKAFKCNGNALCMNIMPEIAICPSYKITKDRVQSPKGRAVLMREYLRQESLGDIDPKFAQEIKQSMDSCLGCKSCVSGCPVNIDVPSFRAEFYERYYKNSKNKRALKDYLLGHFETLISFQAKLGFLNLLLNPFSKLILKKIGLVDLPKLASTKKIKNLKQIPKADFNKIKNIKNLDLDHKPVLLIADALNYFYSPDLLIQSAELLKKFGYTPYLLNNLQNGKALHNLGFLKKFKKLVQKNNDFLKNYTDLSIPILGLEPALTMAFRDEYLKTNPNLGFKVQLVSEFLALSLADHSPFSRNVGRGVGGEDPETYYLIPHCSEKALAPNSFKHWEKIFKNFGLTLKLLDAGCCGMAGSYGHEFEHQDNSKNLYQLSWEKLIQTHEDKILATGHSCRGQVERFGKIKIRHPLEPLADLVSPLAGETGRR